MSISSQAGTQEDHRRAIAKTIAFMKDNLGVKIDMDTLAEVANYTKFHFSRIFLSFTGLSPGRYLAKLRMERAKMLLMETNLTVGTIAAEVGYSSQTTFDFRFKLYTGVSPTDYRCDPSSAHKDPKKAAEASPMAEEEQPVAM